MRQERDGARHSMLQITLSKGPVVMEGSYSIEKSLRFMNVLISSLTVPGLQAVKYLPVFHKISMF